MNEQNKTLNLLWQENRELKRDNTSLIKLSKDLAEERCNSKKETNELKRENNELKQTLQIAIKEIARLRKKLGYDKK